MIIEEEEESYSGSIVFSSSLPSDLRTSKPLTLYAHYSKKKWFEFNALIYFKAAEQTISIFHSGLARPDTKTVRRREEEGGRDEILTLFFFPLILLFLPPFYKHK